ncbi:allophanate hydrolase [Nitrospira sp.]|nr:allophanate hydrolase [Nitrospira sp.]
MTVEFGDAIDPTTNARAVAFAEEIRKRAWRGVVDIVPTYRSVTLHVDPLHLNLVALMKRVRCLAAFPVDVRGEGGRRHSIPVVYGGEWGPDLLDVAAWAKLSVEETVRVHASVEYRVFMLGFAPGFPYLGSVPDRLAMTRLPTPRRVVPAGSVGIAEHQTGIYPVAIPGGWRIIGRTPMPLFRPTADRPFLLSPGDSVRFTPIEPEEFYHLVRECDADRA